MGLRLGKGYKAGVESGMSVEGRRAGISEGLKDMAAGGVNPICDLAGDVLIAGVSALVGHGGGATRAEKVAAMGYVGAAK